MKKIKVLLGGFTFKNLTGSELYLYELARNLVNMNCDVSIVSPNLGNPLQNMVSQFGIKTYNFNTIDKNESFDIIHCQHKPVVRELIKYFPNTPKVCSIHSEIIEMEEPILDESIKVYISIRDQIYDLLVNNFNLSEDKVTIIYNPIDNNKFNTLGIKDENYTLFVGTFENLRRNTVLDLVNYTKEQGRELWLVGENHSNYLPIALKETHVKYYQSTVSIENFIKNCKDTAGILLGRTTIEGWMCGKPGWIYDIDRFGNIKDKNLYTPPSDIEKFYSSNVAKKIKETYDKILL